MTLKDYIKIKMSSKGLHCTIRMAGTKQLSWQGAETPPFFLGGLGVGSVFHPLHCDSASPFDYSLVILYREVEEGHN